VKDHSAARLAQQAAESAALLGPHISVYQVHSATLESGVLTSPDVLRALAALKADRGWRLGLSLSGPAQAGALRLALSLRAPDGARLFDCVQATFNLLEQAAGPALQEAAAAGMGVIIKEGMANGRLLQPPGDARLAPLMDAAAELGCSPDALALAFIMAQPFKPMVLSGASTPAQLASNAAALELAPRLPPALVARLAAALRMDSAAYWAERSALAWN
jgi:aryl-alcohol dehydrogenase-like predicted oxidoreductase